MAVDASGHFIITWEDDRNGITEIYLQRYLSDGTPLGSNFKAEEIIYSEWALDPSINIDEAGNFIVAWRDNRNEVFDIFCKRFDSNGIALGNSFQVNGVYAEVYRYCPCLSMSQDGNFIISWTEEFNGYGNVMAQQFLSDGEPFGNNYQISAAEEMDQSGCKVILQNERIFATWHDNSTGQTGFDVWANVKDWDFWVGTDDNALDETSTLPYLHQNYPNPFHATTTIKFDLSETATVKIEIFNHFGQKMETLFNQKLLEGSHEVDFDAKDVPSGVVFYRMVADYNGEAGRFEQVRGMVVLD